MKTDLTREFHNTVLNFKRDRRHRRIMEVFGTSESLTFLNSDTPNEILTAICDDVLTHQTITILNINNPLSIRRRTSSNQYVLELAHFLGIPVISWDTEFSGAQSEITERTLQLAPTVQHQAQAMVSLLERYNWTAFSVVTSRVAGDVQFLDDIEDQAELSKKKAMSSPADAKRESLEILSTVHIKDLEDTREELSALVGSDTRVFLLHCSFRASYEIIETAVELGLTGPDYIWILTRSSIPTGKYGVKSFPIGLMGISYESELDAMKHVLRVGVKTWLNALWHMAQRPASMTNMTIPPEFTCDSDKPPYWADGHVLYDYMRNVSIRDEPQIRFNSNGTLKRTEVLILNLQPFVDAGKKRTRWKEVGRWKRHGLIMDDITWPGGASIPPSGKPKRAFLRVATLYELPYVIYGELEKDGNCQEKSLVCWVYRRNENKEPVSNVTVKKCCTGLSMDLLKILSDELNFEYKITEVRDGKWGGMNKMTKEWNGLVRVLQDMEADLVLTSFKINPGRAEAVRFSVPYLETGIKINVALRAGAISPTAFLEPYDYASWSLILIFSVHATGASILVFEWLSPYGLNRGLTPLREHKFSLFRSFWLIWAMLFSTSVQTDQPRGIASRFLANIWALFALVLLASYTANLAAFMITKEEYYDLSGIKDYRLQNPYTMNPPFKYATTTDGSTEANIKENHLDMHNYMKTYNLPDVDSGISALKSGKIQAFIYDPSVLEYYASRDHKCRLVTVGNRYAMTGYGVGFPPDFRNPWIDKVSKVILKLQENGEMDRLQKFWLAGACDMRKEKGVSNRTLGILNFTSAFILLGTGVLLGILILVFEHLYFQFGRKTLRKIDKCGCCALVSLSLGKSLRMKDYVDEAISLYTKNRCKDPVCETQIWKLRHQLDMALFKIDNLQAQLRDMNGETAKPVVTPALESARSPDTHQLPTNKANGSNRRSKGKALVRQNVSYDPTLPSPPLEFAESSLVPLAPASSTMNQHPRYAVVTLPDVGYSKDNHNKKDSGNNMAGSFERFFENFDRSPVSGDIEQFAVHLLPESQSLEMTGLDRGGTGSGGGGGDNVGFGVSSVSAPPYSALEDYSVSDAGSARSGMTPLVGSTDASRLSPTPLLRRTPSYTSAVGGSLSSDLSEEKSPAPSGKYRQFDGKKYIGVDNNVTT
ncbi:NR2 [Aplysia californica]|uniref:NR2 n=1 Tax=Aplysia californica TaxID=6500 RepID=D2CMM6_APLCA|nr:NR2 [Aplysia californica]ACA13599.1 NR2 [Aplysia californica]